LGWKILEVGELCEVEIHAHLEPGSNYGDVDHYISNVLDTLTSVVYVDDDQVERVVATRTRDSEEPYVDILIYPSLSGCGDDPGISR
jgi:Holliday junction resolvase RusA-like endonuclease